VPPGDPAARLLREQLQEVTELRNRVAEQESADVHSVNVAAIAAGSVLVLASIGAAVRGVYDLATPAFGLWRCRPPGGRPAADGDLWPGVRCALAPGSPVSRGPGQAA
jgi:hypothetical protein